MAEAKARSMGLSEGSDDYGIVVIYYVSRLKEILDNNRYEINMMMASYLLSHLSYNANTTTRSKLEKASSTGENYKVTPLGRGHTGRTEPNNLKEQLAMEEVMTNPSGKKLGNRMNDWRWNESNGWNKYAQNVNGVEIHYNYNYITGEYDDFKFK